MRRPFMFVPLVILFSVAGRAQQPVQQGHVQIDRSGSVPIVRVTVGARTTKAINYRHRSGSTKIDFRGTPLMPEAKGEAVVNSKKGRIEIKTKMEHHSPTNQTGPN